MFRVRYLLGIRNRLEENVKVNIGSFLPAAANPDIRDSEVPYQLDPNDDDMARLQEYDVHYEELPERIEDNPDRQMPIRERDHSDWMNPYAQEERDYVEDYAWEVQFYEYVSSGDQFW